MTDMTSQWYFMAVRNLDLPIDSTQFQAIDNIFPEYEQVVNGEDVINQRVTPSDATLRERLSTLHLSDKVYRYTRSDQYKEIEQIWLDTDGNEYHKVRIPVLRYSEQTALNSELAAMKAVLESVSNRTFPSYEGDPMPIRDWNELFTQKELL